MPGQGVASVMQAVRKCTYIHTCIHTYIHTHLVTVWAAQFFLVRVPLVTTLLHSSMISSHHFSVHRLWRLSFLLFRHRQWRPCHYISSQRFCAHLLWRLSFLFLVKMRCEAARRSTRDLVLQHTPLQACARRPQCVSSSVGTLR